MLNNVKKLPIIKILTILVIINISLTTISCNKKDEIKVEIVIIVTNGKYLNISTKLEWVQYNLNKILLSWSLIMIGS